MQSSHAAKRFQCQFCDLKYPTQGRLNQQMKYHKNPDQFKCKICGHQAKSQPCLKLHMKRHDENRVKHLKCNRCDYKTDTKGNFEKHLKVHQNNDEKLKTSLNGSKNF